VLTTLVTLLPQGDLAALRLSDTLGGKGLWPLLWNLLSGRFGGIAWLAAGAGAIECPDRIGLEFHHELLDDVLRAFAFC
jgi:hypothetical protein